MTLEYIKLNNNKLDFKVGINYILGESGSGKTTLYRIIKFIYGGNEDKGGKADFSSVKWKNLLNKKNDSVIEWKFSNKEIYKLSLNNKNIIFNEKLISIKEYKNKINKVNNFNHKILNKNIKTINCFSWDTSPDERLESKSNYASFFDEYGIFNITSLKFFHLLDAYEKDVEKYFITVGKKINYSKINKNYNLLENEYNDKILGILKDNESEIDKYLNLSKINKKIIDDKIIFEIKEITKKDVEEIVVFHDKLIESYNDVIDSEREVIENEIDELKKYSKGEIENIKNIIATKKDNLGVIKDLEEELGELKVIREKFDLKVEVMSDNLNEAIANYKNLFKISQEYKFNNKIYYKKPAKKDGNENYIIDLKSIDKVGDKESGGSYITLNFFMFLFYIFQNSSFPVMLFEKKFFVEVNNLQEIEILEKMNGIIKDKQMIIIHHIEEDFKKIKVGNKIILNKLFNIEF